MPSDADRKMPAPASVDPVFDGHPEIPLADMTPDQRIDWIWEMMCLLRQGRAQAPVSVAPVGPKPR
jgi:hypothetical protein